MAQDKPAELVIFSGRKEPLIKPVLDLFQKQSGIKIVLKTGKSAVLGQQILQELPHSTADVYIAKESGSLEYLRMKNAFEFYSSENTERIPIQYKSRDGSWIGISGRSRALIYNKGMVNLEDVPVTLNALLDPKWKGKIAAVNSSNESLIAWVSALRLKLGDDHVRALLTKLKENDIQLISHSHTDIRKAVGRGEFPLGLVNHYYYHLQMHEIDPAMRNVGIVYLDQEEGGRGEIVNVCGVGIIKGAKNLEAAKEFVDFLTSNAAQQLFSKVNFEYPLRPDVDTHEEVLNSIGCPSTSFLDCLKQMEIQLDELGPAMDKTVELLEEVQWYL